MVKTFFTSDTHWFHENIITYSKRPFANVEHMSQSLIDNWNSVVNDDDTVYHLGDVAMGGFKMADRLSEILDELNGNIRLISGNHDTYVLSEPCVDRFEWVKEYYELNYTSPKSGRRKFVLCHFPFYTWNGAGKRNKNGTPYSINLHGHCHGNIDRANASTTRMDVGVDSNDYRPIDIEDIIAKMDKKSYGSVDHHK